MLRKQKSTCYEKYFPPLASKAACRFAGWSPHLLGFQSSRGACPAAHAARPAAPCAAPLGDENQYRIMGVKQARKTKLVELNMQYARIITNQIQIP